MVYSCCLKWQGFIFFNVDIINSPPLCVCVYMCARVCVYTPQFVYIFTCRCTVYILAIVNNAPVNMGLHTSLVFLFSKWILRSGVTGFYGSPISNFFEEHPIVFFSGCINLYSQSTRVPLPLYLHQHVLFLFFLIIAVLTVWGNNALWFWFVFPWSAILSIFSCIWWYLYVFGKNSYSDLLIFNWIVFVIELYTFFIYVGF